MPLQDHMKLISVDDHVIEHATVFTDRLPSGVREQGPRLITADRELRGGHILGEVVVREGEQTWVYEDRLYPQLALNAVAGLDPKEWVGREPTRYDQILPGCYDPAARVADMDADGIHAMLLFPTFPRFAGTTFLDAKDKSVALLCVQAWNDFIVEEWSGPYPGRFVPMMILPLWDVDLCVAEVSRMAGRGAKCIAFPENPYPLGLPSWSSGHWDPLCAVAQEHSLPLCMHFGTSGRVEGPSPDCNPLAVTVSFGLNSMSTMADLLFSHVFHKFPDLRVVLSEGGIGWMPWLLERAETVWDRHRWYGGVNTEANPRDLFARHIFGCFISDEAGISQRHVIGVDNIMWECDYPHADSNWPNARKQLAESLIDVPDDEVHQIVELNARRIFNFWD
jgi:predicted TIM-barrel fold metal-dependent hydrolase